MFLFMFFRLFYFGYFHDKTTTALSFSQFCDFLIAGFKFDSAATGVCLAVPFLLNCFLQPLRLGKWVAKVRHLFAGLFFISVSLLGICGITYISEYGSQYNHLMLEGLYDDQQAIILTAIQQYQPWGSLLSLLMLITLSLCWNKKVDRTTPRKLTVQNKWVRCIITVVTIVLFICAARGSFETRPASRKWSAVTSDTFVNNLVINPFRSFIYAIEDFRELNSITSTNENPYSSTATEIDALLNSNAKTSNGPLLNKPSHIFYIVMESFDSWPLQDKYRSLKLTEQFHQLKQQGLYIEQALPAASSTMNSLSSLISGIPYSGVNMSRLNVKYDEYSLFELMKSQSYNTNFYYGGLLSWQKVGEFVKHQGADSVYSAADAGGKGSAGAWGVDDEQLFDLVSQTVKENSFNMILTTSYHGPFNLDLSNTDYPWQHKDYPAEISALSDNLLEQHILGHLWYSDQQLGKFVNRMRERHPKALFVITGDHYSRRYLHPQPNLYELTHVPILILGENVTQNMSDHQFASHMDITPTLMDLIAKPNSPYASFGNSLVSASSHSKVVHGHKTTRTAHVVWRETEAGQYDHFSIKSTHNEPHDESFVSEQYHDYMGASWHLLMSNKHDKLNRNCTN